MSIGVIAAHDVISGGGGSYAAAVLADSPLVYWKFNETSGTTAIDSSGNGRDGTYSGSVALGATSLVTSDPSGKSMDVTPSGQASIANAAWMQPGVITAEALCNPDAVSGVHLMAGRINFDASLGADYSWGFGVRDGHFYYIIYPGSGGVTEVTVAGTTIAIGTTYHMAMTYDGSNLRAYLNGSLVDTTPRTGTLNAGNQDLRVGRGKVTRDYFDGRIDEFALYGAALSGARIAAHYAAA